MDEDAINPNRNPNMRHGLPGEDARDIAALTAGLAQISLGKGLMAAGENALNPDPSPKKLAFGR